MDVKFFVGLLMVIVATECYAHETERDDSDCRLGYITKRCLSGDQPSYFVWVPESGDDQSHIEFFLSVKYPVAWLPDKPYHRLYFGYTGKYDFYWPNTRESSPIISRLQNPGLFYKYIKQSDSKLYESEKFDVSFRNFSLGIFHESNGQGVDNPELFRATRDSIQLSLDNDPSLGGNADVMARDFISRSWNYIGLTTKFRFDYSPWKMSGDKGNSDERVAANLYIKARGYFGEPEDNFGWSDPNGVRIDPEDVSIEDYNTFSFILAAVPLSEKKGRKDYGSLGDFMTRARAHGRYSLSITTGRKLNNWTYRLQATYHFFRMFPATVFYHNGYLNNISDYYKKVEYIGIGIEIW